MALITVDQPHDYTAEALTDISDLTFTAPAAAWFSASQFGGTAISNSLHLTGESSSDWLVISMDSAGAFSTAGWSFTTWSGTMQVSGSDGADTITVSSGFSSVLGGKGGDTLAGGDGVDLFRYGPGDIAPGESVNGGAGIDNIMVEAVVGGATYDFSSVPIANIEVLAFNAGATGGASTVILSDNQIGPGAIAGVFGGLSCTNALIVAGATVDLSGVTFTDWTTGTDTITIKGTPGADVLTGSDQNDVIDGGLSGDQMTGGAGADTYFVQSAGDVVDESLPGSGGADGVRASVTFSLADGTHAKGLIETLILTGTAGIKGTGNGLANLIVGNRGHNVLNGAGGDDRVYGGGGSDTIIFNAGHDTLTGGRGADGFFFKAALASNNVAALTDFQVGHDVIELKHGIFKAIAVGALAADAFHVGMNAADRHDRIVYDKVHGDLYYDADGAGGHAKVLIATIENHAALGAADFVVLA